MAEEKIAESPIKLGFFEGARKNYAGVKMSWPRDFVGGHENSRL
jgi:hypothetical protein